MNEEAWRVARDSRSMRYAGRVINPDRPVLLRGDARYCTRYDGQVAVLTAANLLARMTPNVALDVPAVPLVAPLPWKGRDLKHHALETMFAADPFGRFETRQAKSNDYLVHLGAEGSPFTAHGSGWNIFLGPGPSPIPATIAPNPIGPVMAAILAAACAFRTNLMGTSDSVILNALEWRSAFVDPSRAEFAVETDVGDIWTVGTGSVGTATLYFLAMATRRFATTLFDMDTVQIHNLDRSPIFVARDVGRAKVEAMAAWLREVGVCNVRSEPVALDQSEIWRDREAGTPDVILAAANERNVRAVIETGFPPVQIYGTTGKNWQAAVLRHIPLKDPCSSCLFPEATYAPTACATDRVVTADKRIDAALPFLSFAAGAMAASEILKLSLPGYPFASNRVVLNTRPSVRAVRASQAQRDGCICERRSAVVHRQMIDRTRYATASI